MTMITAWSKVVPDGGVAFADLAKFAVARMPKLIVKRRMEKERIRAACLFGVWCKSTFDVDLSIAV
jgi:hypothetical protein